MFTLLLAGRSHIISDLMAERLLAALDSGKAFEWIEVEMNGEGSGMWDVAINLAQIVALVRHPSSAESKQTPLRLIRNS